MTSVYLVDKSALARSGNPVVGARLESLGLDGRIATCAMIDLEVLFSARNFESYEASLVERRSMRDVPITPLVTDAAIAIQHGLAETGRHRVAIPDLLIAAAAQSAGLTVLHYDADFELIASVTDVEHEWVAPRGSLSP